MSGLSIYDIPLLFGYVFFRNAIIGGSLAAIVCASVGLFLILRKEAMIGDGVAHASFGGIALGLYLGVYPLLTALLVALLSVIGISFMRKKGLAQSDAAIAVMMATGFSVGLILISLAGGFNVDLFAYLFGSILTISMTDLMLVTALGFSTLFLLGLFYRELLVITFDEDSARLTGIPSGIISISFNVLVAFTIVLSIKIVGVILVTALLVLPGLSALQLRMSFRGTMLASISLALAGVVGGLLISVIVNVATSGVIVFTTVLLFILSVAYRKAGETYSA